MSSTDPWAKRWTLNYSDNPKLNDVILVNSGLSPSIFTLTPVKDSKNGNLVAYRVDFNDDEMTSCWRNCYLFPRGGAADPTVDDTGMPSLPLPDWTLPTSSADPPAQKDYETVVLAIGQKNDKVALPQITRLEGDIHPFGKDPESVTMFQLVSTTGNHPIRKSNTFLYVRVGSNETSQENGIAHGND